MRRTAALMSTIVAAALAACTTTNVATDWDHTVDFSNYVSFRLLEGQPSGVAFADQHARQSVKNALVAKGFREANTGASFLVVTHLGGKVRRQVNVHHYGYGYHWGGWGGVGGRSVSVQEIPTGTIVVDIIDASSKHLEWRAIAKQELTGNPTKDQKRIDKAISRMFYDFPPGR